jgi:hypothetical protein
MLETSGYISLCQLQHTALHRRNGQPGLGAAAVGALDNFSLLGENIQQRIVSGSGIAQFRVRNCCSWGDDNRYAH